MPACVVFSGPVAEDVSSVLTGAFLLSACELAGETWLRANASVYFSIDNNIEMKLWISAQTAIIPRRAQVEVEKGRRKNLHHDKDAFKQTGKG